MSDNGGKNIDAALAARKQAEADTARNERAAAEARGNLNSAKNNPVAPNTERIESEDFVIEEKSLTLDEIRARGVSGERTHSEEFESVIGGNVTREYIAMERFMHEEVTITVAESADEEALQIIALVVNGTMQPICRGVATTVKRKYVEALARAKETRYKQVQMNPNDPASLEMVPRTALAYPFAVEEDRNPNGRAWLRAILKQAA